jgi:isochorismate synthase EntC
VDDQGNTISQSAASSYDYTKLVNDIADTLASQLITKVLIANDLPASIAAQAFADALISTALAKNPSVVGFSANFAVSVFNIAGGLPDRTLVRGLQTH